MDYQYEEESLQFFEEHIKYVSILVVTATSIEKEALHKSLKPTKGKGSIIQVAKGKQTYYFGVFGKFNIVHVACGDMGSIGRASSTITTSDAITECKPKIVIMVGIAFGVDKKKQKIGDVLVSERVIMYEPQRMGKVETIYRSKEGPASSLLINRFQNTNDWKFKIAGRFAEINIGAVLTGEKLIDNPIKKQELVKQYQTAIGGEMEGGGIYSACDGRVDHWIMVKAVCDYADGNKGKNKKKNQQIAAESAVGLCENLFNKLHSFDEIGVYPFDSGKNDYKDPKGNKAMTDWLFQLNKKQIFDED